MAKEGLNMTMVTGKHKPMIFSYVNYDIWKGLTSDERIAFIAEHCNHLLLGSIHMKEDADPEKELKRNYSVVGRFHVIDYKLEGHGAIAFSLKWSRKDGVKAIKIDKEWTK